MLMKPVQCDPAKLKALLARNEILRRAADHIRKNGWCQNANFRNGAACIFGAITMVSFDTHGIRRRSYKAAVNALRHHLGTEVAAWNDAPDRTVDQVLDALSAAEHVAP